MMVSSFRGDTRLGGAEEKKMLEEAAAGRGDVRLKTTVTPSEQQQQRSRVVSIEEPRPHPPSILKRERDRSASTSRPRSPAPTQPPKRRPTADSPFRKESLVGPQQQGPKTPTTPKNRGNLPPDPNSVRQQTKGMSQRERLRFKASRLVAPATASTPQAPAASPALRSEGVAKATPPQIRVQERLSPLNLALPKPLPRGPVAVRPKGVGYQGGQPPVAHRQGWNFANPPQFPIQTDFRYPPNFIGHSSGGPIFGGPSVLPPYPMLAEQTAQQPGASRVTPVAVLATAPAPPELDPRRLQLCVLRQQEREKAEEAEQARKRAEEAEVEVRRLTEELAQAIPPPPTTLPASDWSNVAYCNPHADDSLWQMTTPPVVTPKSPSPPPAHAVEDPAAPDEFLLSPDTQHNMDFDEELDL